jgi:hypothetical protein
MTVYLDTRRFAADIIFVGLLKAEKKGDICEFIEATGEWTSFLVVL